MAKRYVGQGDDLRVRKTKRAIRDAALALMERDPAKEPTAASIIEAAEINKSTFYYHYESVQDLLGQIEQEAFDDVMAKAARAISCIATDPARFLRRFGQFVYEEPSTMLLRNGRLKATMLDTVASYAGEVEDLPIDPSVVEVVLLGLWGYTRHATREEYEQSIPALTAFLNQGIATTGSRFRGDTANLV